MYTDWFERTKDLDGITRYRYPRLYQVVKYVVATGLMYWAITIICNNK